MTTNKLSTDILLDAYANGVFPMADDGNDKEFYWVQPQKRGIIPLDSFHIPRRLQRLVKQEKFSIKYNKNFNAVINECAEKTPARNNTWINNLIKNAYIKLHKQGYAHCVECYLDDKLVGGLYGVHLQSAFFGESMFSRANNASKIALVYLVEKLKQQKFTLLDAQFMNEHLKQFGAVEISQREYMKLLEKALKTQADFGN